MKIIFFNGNIKLDIIPQRMFNNNSNLIITHNHPVWFNNDNNRILPIKINGVMNIIILLIMFIIYNLMIVHIMLIILKSILYRIIIEHIF